jgi:hypothetical protein
MGRFQFFADEIQKVGALGFDLRRLFCPQGVTGAAGVSVRKIGGKGFTAKTSKRYNFSRCCAK